jgi:hypothetical protein
MSKISGIENFVVIIYPYTLYAGKKESIRVRIYPGVLDS